MNLVLDLTSVASGTCRDHGVACFERTAARWALDQADARFDLAFHDTAGDRIVTLPEAAARAAMAGQIRIGPEPTPDATARAARLRRALRHPRRTIRDLIAPWSSRGPAFTQADFESTLARILDGGSPAPPNGPRIVPLGELSAVPLAPSRGVLLVSLGSVTHAWLDRVRDLKSRGVSYVGYCHEFGALDRADVAAPSHADLADDQIWTADLLLTHAAAAREDITRYCAAHGIPAPAMAVAPPACDVRESAIAPEAAPAPGRYVLSLATREPDLRFIHEAWRGLRRESRLPEDIKLVLADDFEGRALDAVDAMARDPVTMRSVEIIDDANDEEWAWLCRRARFCIEPSAGAATAAALGIGKACLVGDDEAAAECFGARATRLAPGDQAAWRGAIADLCDDDDAVRAAEVRAARDPAPGHAIADLFAAITDFAAARR